MKPQEIKQEYGKLISECWQDDALRQHFMEAPAEVLKERGIPVENGNYKVVVQPKGACYIVLPQKDAQQALQQCFKHMNRNMQENDMLVGEGDELRIIQNTQNMQYLIFPEKPDLECGEKLEFRQTDDIEIIHDIMTFIVVSAPIYQPLSINMVVVAI